MGRRHVDFAFSRKLAKRLREERERRGMSVRALSRLTGLAPTTIYNAESGQFEPLASTIIRIAQAYNCPVDDICNNLN